VEVINFLKICRVILDEAQLVDSHVSNASQMASMIPRINSWVVTGTPASKTNDFRDLQNLFYFTRFYFVFGEMYFESIAKMSVEYCRSELSSFIHAEKKCNVQNEIKIAGQSVNYVTIHFESVEALFYDDLYHTAKTNIGMLFMAYKESLEREATTVTDKKKHRENRDKTQNILEELNNEIRSWILRLRQTWFHFIKFSCHPQIARENKV
jgi:hypothetical protein